MPFLLRFSHTYIQLTFLRLHAKLKKHTKILENRGNHVCALEIFRAP